MDAIYLEIHLNGFCQFYLPESLLDNVVTLFKLLFIFETFASKAMNQYLIVNCFKKDFLDKFDNCIYKWP